MERFPPWARLVFGIYLLLLCAVVAVPFWLFHGATDESLFLVISGFVLALLLAGALLFVIPVRARRFRPIRRRSVWFPIIGTSIFIAALFASAALAISDARQEEIYEQIALWGIAPVWLAWVITLGWLCRRGNIMAISPRLYQSVVVGSAIELLIAVPSHLIARRRPECCVGIISGMAIGVGVIVAIILIGPGIYFLFQRRWKLYYADTSRDAAGS